MEQHIHFQQRDVKDLEESEEVWIYNHKSTLRERLEEKEALPELYRTIGESYRNLDDWSMFLITSYTDARSISAERPTETARYNGMIKSYFYQFMGPKPPKRRREEA